MDYVLQAGLSVGMSSTSGFHSKTPARVAPELNGANVRPMEFCPGPKDRMSFPTIDPSKPVHAAPIAIGAWPWGDQATWHWKDEELPAVKEAWHMLYAAGLNFIDTAQTYGNGTSEKLVGDLISDLPRESVILQTKYFPNPLGIENYIHPIEAPVSALRQSIERMRCQYVDIYLVHGPVNPQSMASLAQGMAKCVTEGLARTVGIANHSPEDTIKFADYLGEYGIPLATNQCEFSILRRWAELHDGISTCRNRGIIFQGYSSLASGRLSGKYSAENPPPSTYRFSSYHMVDIEPTLEVLRRIGAKHNKAPASIALNYNISKGVLPVVGIRKPEQAKQAIDALGWRLSLEEMKEIDSVSMEGQTTMLWQQG